MRRKMRKETIEKQDVDTNISVKCVNDRRLFMICVNGVINKYKFNIKLKSFRFR